MEHGKLALGTLVVALVVVVLVASPPAGAAVLRNAADWQMNERSWGMVDSSANENHGTPTGVLRTGSTYLFDGSTSRVSIPDDSSLDPRSKDITLSASVRMAGASLDDDSYDVVRKGLSATQGGDYKMEILRSSTTSTVGRLHCSFKGAGGRRVWVLAPVDVVDGRWHSLACTKTRASVVASVDGRTYAQGGSAGQIANSSAVMVGAKTASPLDDVFEGSMGSVRITIAR